jgi:hypothetical protein
MRHHKLQYSHYTLMVKSLLKRSTTTVAYARQILQGQFLLTLHL